MKAVPPRLTGGSVKDLMDIFDEAEAMHITCCYLCDNEVLVSVDHDEEEYSYPVICANCNGGSK